MKVYIKIQNKNLMLKNKMANDATHIHKEILIQFQINTEIIIKKKFLKLNTSKEFWQVQKLESLRYSIVQKENILIKSEKHNSSKIENQIKKIMAKMPIKNIHLLGNIGIL